MEEAGAKTEKRVKKEEERRKEARKEEMGITVDCAMGSGDVVICGMAVSAVWENGRARERA